MISFNAVAKRVWQVLKGRGYNLKIYQNNGEIALDPETEARKFYIEDEGILVSISDLGEDSEIKVYMSEENSYEEIKALISNLRQVASDFGILFNFRKYGKKLVPKEFSALTYKVKQEEDLAEAWTYKNPDMNYRYPQGFVKYDLSPFIDKIKAGKNPNSRVVNGIFIANMNNITPSFKSTITRRENKGILKQWRSYVNGIVQVYVPVDSESASPESLISSPHEVTDDLERWINDFSITEEHDEDEQLAQQLSDIPELSQEIKKDPKKLNKFIKK
jgi:hypothetical protein